MKQIYKPLNAQCTWLLEHLLFYVGTSSLAPFHCSYPKVLVRIYRSYSGLALKYLFADLSPPPLTVRFAHLIALTFLSHERGLLWLNLELLPSLPSLWNQLPSSTRSLILTGGPGASFRYLKTAL